MKLSFPESAALKTFLLRLFAIVGFFFSFLILMAFLGAHSWTALHRTEVRIPESMVLTLDFTQPIVEKPRDFTLALSALLNEEKETPLLAIVRALDAAKDDPRVKAVVARFNAAQKPSLAQVEEIGAALQRFRASGKPTYSFATSYGPFASGGALFALASQFEQRWLQPVGAVGLTPIGIEAPFGKSALEKIGITSDFMRREEYKSFLENVERDSFSPPVRENMQSLVADIQSQIVETLAKSLDKNTDAVAALIARGPFTANEALKEGLVTKLGYDDELRKEIEAKTGKSEEVGPVAYLSYVNAADTKPAKAEVALVFAEGMIADTPSKGPARLAAGDTIDADALVKAFGDIAKNPKIKAVLFRLNSPGGSPTASETIRRGLIKLKESGRPVFVSMGTVAASGGYWIAMNADQIIADPATLTGSIGVVAGKFVFGGLYDKLGIAWDTLGAQDGAQLWSTRRPFGPKEQERMNAMLDETYKAFLENVSAARKIPMDKMQAVAKGRVFTGAQALEAGLVDRLGGIDDAVGEIKKQLKLAETDKITLRTYPERETAQTFFMRILRQKGLGGALAQAPGILGAGAMLSGLAPLWDEVENAGQARATMPVSFSTLGW